MERNMLNEEENARLMQMLNGETPETNAPVPEPQPSQAEPPVEDMAAPVDSAAAATPAAATPDPTAELLASLGVSSVEELVSKYKERDSKATEYQEMLSQLLAFQQALDNEQELEPSDPMNGLKKAIREEMGPVYDKLQTEARNKLVQEAWGKDAKDMPDIAEVMPEITKFIVEHPELSTANDGLKRAYNAVRSAKYRSEEELLKDDEFIKRMANNDKIKDAVLKDHLESIARTGGSIPNSIGEGGNVPLTGQRPAPDSMEQAKRGLGKMLGLK